MASVATLGEVARLLATIEVRCNRCNRCDRREWLRTDRLLAQHSPSLPIPELRRIITLSCPRMIGAKMHDVCGAHFPSLGGLL